MSADSTRIGPSTRSRGGSLVELMISLVIGMLMVIVIYQVYVFSEVQKRTITGGSDAQQSASYAMFALSRDLSMAGNGIASAAPALDQCVLLRSLPVVIAGGASAATPDTITVLYGGSASLSTPVAFMNSASAATPYQVRAPVGFSPGNVIAAVMGTNCTLSTIDAGGVDVAANGIATLRHTVISGPSDFVYPAITASVVNLGPAAMLGRVRFEIDRNIETLASQNLLPTEGPKNPIGAAVINLKAQYGLDTDNDGGVDVWQDPQGAVWSSDNLVVQPIATLRQIRAVRVAIVTRSEQYERDIVTPGPLVLLNETVTMPLTDDQQHYRYRILETIVPLRNAIWNAP